MYGADQAERPPGPRPTVNGEIPSCSRAKRTTASGSIARVVLIPSARVKVLPSQTERASLPCCFAF